MICCRRVTITVTNAEEESISFTYTANGQIETVTDAEGNVTGYTYDACGNLTRIKDPLGNITCYEYDAMNRQIREYLPEGTEKPVRQSIIMIREAV